MLSKEYYKTKIKELEFQKNIKKNKNNRNHITFIALLSVTIILFVFEIQKFDKPNIWIIILGITFLILLWIINKEISYPENKKIQNTFNTLLGRKK